MTLQVLPPEMLETQDKIETKEAQPYWKPSSLKDGESEEFRLLGCYETGHAIMGWQYASEIADPKTGDLRFNGYVVTLLAVTLVLLLTLPVKPTGPKQNVPRLMEPSSSLVVSSPGLQHQQHVVV